MKDYFVCGFVYKKDNSDGWYYAETYGDTKKAGQKCLSFKKKYNWYDFKTETEYLTRKKPSKACFEEFDTSFPDLYDLHFSSKLVYNPFDNKFYYPQDFMAYPQKEPENKCGNDFKITLYFGDFCDISSYTSDFDFEDEHSVYLKFDPFEVKQDFFAEEIYEDLPKFIKDLRRKKSAVMSLNWFENSGIKFLAWQKQDNVRLLIYSCHKDIYPIADCIVPADVFYGEFSKLFDTIRSFMTELETAYKKFKNNLIN